MEAVIFRESSIAEENCDLRSRNVHRALSQFLNFGDSDEVRGLHVVFDENGFADHVMYCSLVICRLCLDAFSIFIFSQLVLGNRFLLKGLVLPSGACHSVFSSREILPELTLERALELQLPFLKFLSRCQTSPFVRLRRR